MFLQPVSYKIHVFPKFRTPNTSWKKIRNGVESSRKDNTGKRRKLCKDGNTILWDHWIAAHRYNASLNIRKHRALTDDHIFLTSDLKMRNHLAEQELDKEMLLLMISYQQSVPEKEKSALNATIFLKQASTLVDIFLDVNRPIKQAKWWKVASSGRAMVWDTTKKSLHVNWAERALPLHKLLNRPRFWAAPSVMT